MFTYNAFASPVMGLPGIYREQLFFLYYATVII